MVGASQPAFQEFEALSDDRKVEVLRKIMATWRLPASQNPRQFMAIAVFSIETNEEATL